MYLKIFWQSNRKTEDLITLYHKVYSTSETNINLKKERQVKIK